MNWCQKAFSKQLMLLSSAKKICRQRKFRGSIDHLSVLKSSKNQKYVTKNGVWKSTNEEGFHEKDEKKNSRNRFQSTRLKTDLLFPKFHQKAQKALLRFSPFAASKN